MTSSASSPSQPSLSRFDTEHPHYKWVALSNTTLGMLMATVNASIVIISLPAIFRGIRLDPLEAGNVSYLLWMLMGYLLVTAVLVVTFGRLGDMYGRVRIYNLGFVVFTIGLDRAVPGPDHRRPRRAVADRLAGRPGRRRGDAVRQLDGDPHRRVPRRTSAAWRWASTRSPAIAGSFIGLVVGGVLVASGTGGRCSGSACRSACSAPCGRTARCTRLGAGKPGKLDWLGQHDLRGRPDRAAGRHHLRHPALRRAHDGLDQPVGARPD